MIPDCISHAPAYPNSVKINLLCQFTPWLIFTDIGDLHVRYATCQTNPRRDISPTKSLYLVKQQLT